MCLNLSDHSLNSMMINPPSIPDLIQASNTVHLLYHHNHNQHRHSTWWKHLSTLKRSLQKLIHDLSTNSSDALNSTTQTKIVYLKKTIVPKCHVFVMQNYLVSTSSANQSNRAFSQVVADPQFAPLGLVLLATLARVNALLVLPQDEKVTSGRRKGLLVAAEPPSRRMDESSEDLGSHVARATMDDLPVDVNLAELGSLESQAQPASFPEPDPVIERDGMSSRQKTESDALEVTLARKERKKKRKRPKDEIDDLFAGLL